MKNKEKLFLFFIINWLNNPRNEKLDAFICRLQEKDIWIKIILQREFLNLKCGPIASKKFSKYKFLANLSHWNTILKEETMGNRNYRLTLFLIKGNYIFTWLNPKNDKSQKLKLG